MDFEHSFAEKLPQFGATLEKNAERLKGLCKGSYVVPFGVCYGFLVRDYSILPKKELHKRVWVIYRYDMGVVSYMGLCWGYIGV